MKVFIGDQVFDSSEEPVLVILTDQEKEVLSRMKWNEHKYCSFPSNMSELEMRAWMQSKH